jgi:hypothetical protein
LWLAQLQQLNLRSYSSSWCKCKTNNYTAHCVPRSYVHKSCNTWERPFSVLFRWHNFALSFCFHAFHFPVVNSLLPKTTEEVDDIYICIQKQIFYPNALGWSTSELKSFSSQLKNNKVEFNVCVFFTLNLQFFCASVSVIFTYILVLNHSTRGLNRVFFLWILLSVKLKLFTYTLYDSPNILLNETWVMRGKYSPEFKKIFCTSFPLISLVVNL